MSKIKPVPHALETEDLLKLLDQEEEIKEEVPVDYDNDVLNFIANFQIEPGTEKVKQHTLYLIYKAWSKSPLKKTEFTSKMGLYFELCKSGTSTAYLINQNAIKITHAAYKYFSNKNTRLTSKHWSKHFENFLKFHSLTKGKFWIHGSILYFIYDKFCHATGLDKRRNSYLGEDSFLAYCRLYLPEKKTKNGFMYAVSDNIQQFFQIGQLERMQASYEKKGFKKQKKGNSKRTGKVRRFKPENES